MTRRRGIGHQVDDGVLLITSKMYARGPRIYSVRSGNSGRLPAVITDMEAAVPVRVLGISGSLRKASTNRAVIRAAARIGGTEFQVTAFEGLELIPPFNPDIAEAATPSPVRALGHAIASADAVLISAPEYAHGVPGVLKNALDWLVASGEFIGKPVAVINASSRATHAWSSLVETLRTMSAHVVLEASITLPLDGRAAHADAILRDSGLTSALRDALATVTAEVRRQSVAG